MKNAAALGGSLVELGLSQYEAQAYIGLMGKPPSTGYALSNETGIPQPKVYETLRRLAEKGYVVKVDDDPARYVAISPDQLLAQLEGDVQKRLVDARSELEELLDGRTVNDVEFVQLDSSWDAIRTRALALIERSAEHVYLSGYAEHIAQLAEAIEAADARGVRFDVLTFGNIELNIPHGGAVRHDVTTGIVYRHHQDRHLAVVVDSTCSMWALAPSGDDWSGLSVGGHLFASVVKEYVRHDLYVQRIFAEFREPLEQRFGPGLQQLVVQTKPAAKPTVRAKKAPATKASTASLPTRQRRKSA